MNFSFDIQDDVRYKQGLEVGRVIWPITVIRKMLNHQDLRDSKTIASVINKSIEFVEQAKHGLKNEAEILKAYNEKGTSLNSIAEKFKVSKTFIWALKDIVENENQQG